MHEKREDRKNREGERENQSVHFWKSSHAASVREILEIPLTHHFFDDFSSFWHAINSFSNQRTWNPDDVSPLEMMFTLIIYPFW